MENKEFIIKESDFILKPSISDSYCFWDLTFYKRVKKRDTGKYEMELGNTMYGIPLSNALTKIAYHRTAKKFNEDNIRLFDYIKALDESYKEILKLCKEKSPEDFDTGE